MNTMTEELSGDVASRAGAPHMPTAPALARRLKRFGDVAATLVLAIFVSPLLLLIAVAIKVQDGGPVLFRHNRCGKGGEAFALWKFRTMRVDAAERLTALLELDPDAEAEWIRTRKLRSDPRVTRLGRVLRKSSLDELPQILNILRGDMSIVGPRPVMAEELSAYGGCRAHYEAVRPGITGLWQISGRNDLTFDERVAYDTAYVQRWTLGGDALILLRTVPVVFTAKGAY